MSHFVHIIGVSIDCSQLCNLQMVEFQLHLIFLYTRCNTLNYMILVLDFPYHQLTMPCGTGSAVQAVQFAVPSARQ